MRVAYLGNFLPGIAEPWSTEHHLRLSLEELGHEVMAIQEGEVQAKHVAEAAFAGKAEVFLWTQTYGLAESGGSIWERQLMRETIEEQEIPTVAVHLDRYWGLERQDQIGSEPWWGCDLVCSADGGHDGEFAELGIRHRWFQPGVLRRECVEVAPDRQAAGLVVFVGSYNYHPAWDYRPRLIDWLRASYHRRFRLYPRRRQVRGLELNALYQGAGVVVGDSCLVPNRDGSPVARYWSDRIPETLGRGGFLIHPWVEGIDEFYADGEHLRLYELGDFTQLRALIDHYLRRPGEARAIARAGQRHVVENHTYTHRMAEVLAAAVPGA